ncbi:MAG: aldo/keto reductase, partial [Nitriliruptorales bacterium]|nr:aldo/keto reductase [Nitriliruptorales bacterium]
NFFDTANVYAAGRAEEVVGKTLADVTRDSYVLATKVFFPMPHPAHPGPNDRGLSRKHVWEQLHHSLRRLGTDYVDLYQCHRYDESVPLEETCRVMADMIGRGEVLYWGTSEWSADQIAHAVTLCRLRGWPEPVSNQPQYSALWRRIERRILPVSKEVGLGQVVWSPLAMGVLTGKYSSMDCVPPDSRAAGEYAAHMGNFMTPEILEAVQRVKPIAQEAGCSLSQLALAWCLRDQGISSVVVGATKTSHVEDNVAAADLTADPALLSRVDDVLAPVAHR